MTGRSILILAFVLMVTHAFPKCAPSALQVWPPRGVITTNSVFILSLVRNAQDYTEKFQKKNTIYLREFNSANKIALLPVESYTGEFEITQISYRPEIPLKENNIYYLYIPSLSEEELENLTLVEEVENDEDEVLFTYMEDAIWQVTGTDTIPPASMSPPVFVENIYRRFGCGPAVNTYFTSNFTDSGFIAFKIILSRTDTVASSVTGWITEYVLLDVDEEISLNNPAVQNTAIPSYVIPIGFNMCFGMFKLEYGKPYKAIIQAMDASGNYCKTIREQVFTSPTPTY